MSPLEEIRGNSINKVKTDLRISHNALDDDLNDQITACLDDLSVCGVRGLEMDPLIMSAIKLWCRANYTDDTSKAAAYMARYDSLKACLMMSSYCSHRG